MKDRAVCTIKTKTLEDDKFRQWGFCCTQIFIGKTDMKSEVTVYVHRFCILVAQLTSEIKHMTLITIHLPCPVSRLSPDSDQADSGLLN